MKQSQLEVLMGAYYHEDFAGIWETLDRFVGESSASENAELITNIHEFLAQVSSDAVLDTRLRAMGSNVYLGDDPAAYRTWLEEIARRVASA